MPNRKQTLILLLTALAAMLIVGCGGGDDESSTTSTSSSTTEASTTSSGEPLSTDDYVSEIQGILQPLGADLTSLGTSLQSAQTPDEIASGVGDVQSKLDDSISTLQGVSPPEDVASEHEELIAALQAFDDSLDPVREAAENGDQEALQSAALDVPKAASEFQTKLADLAKRFQQAGVPLGQGATP